ncbi:carbohydrate kinase [Methanobacterium sp. CWC-01]|uniref:PfkB family carbohydrate kinase n=1 Tax=Methanobacterium aridiramus TaxID=2584467 RepID=UPI0025758259|nr:PfkB family carbohydrate kinase [Methanobacterium sp. CWC-01]WJI09027.1 carbohydrate kinase [Methanobacterium sp. CWC-01]
MANFLLLGPVTRDTIIRQGSTYHSTGGPVYYHAGVLDALGVDATALVTVGKEDKGLLDSFPSSLRVIPSFRENTANFENYYPSSDPNQRKQRANLPCNPLRKEDFKDLDLHSFDAFLVSPLSPADIPLEILRYLHQTEKPIYMGIQGYMRHLENFEVVLKPWKDHHKFLPFLKIIFMDELEARMVLGIGYSELEIIAQKLAANGPEEVIITLGDRGSLIYSSRMNKVHRIPAVPPHKTVDPTGLGDSYMAAYACKRLETPDPEKCGIFASQIASLKLEKQGALKLF